jgi:signal peptidase I
MDGKKFKKIMKKVWYFIWEDNSIWSWLVNIILAVIIIKFIVYPVLGLALGTSYPIVAVVSGSMEHDYVFNEFWQEKGDFYIDYNITKEDFSNFKFSNGFNKGDIMVLTRATPENIKVGDILVFQSPTPDPIIHRTIDIWKENGDYYFTTKGDHNDGINNNVQEGKISEDRMLGKARLRVPYLGYVKIGFVKFLNFIEGIFKG